MQPTKRQRWCRRALWGVALLAALVPLYYAVENWRGSRAWSKAKTAYEASGRSLDWNVLFHSEPPPEASNFCAIPLLRDLFLEEGAAAEAHRERLMGPRFKNSAFRRTRAHETGEPFDYEAFREVLLNAEDPISLPQNEPDAARAVLVGLEDAMDWFDELDAASGRSEAQFLPPYLERLDPQQPWAMQLPHATPIRRLQGWLRYRACVAIGCGETEKVRLSLTSSFRLVQASGSEPTLINHLITLTMTTLLIDPIWQSIHDRIWSDAELQWLESELAQIDLIKNYNRSLLTETAFAMTAIDHLKKEAHALKDLMGPRDRFSVYLFSLTPKGHLDLEKARRIKRRGRLQAAFETNNPRTIKTTLEELTREFNTAPPNAFTALGGMDMFNKSTQSTVVVHTQIQQARLAVALERYYLKHETYPGELGELVPSIVDALPDDPMRDGWRYSPSADRQDYTLYSVGWDLIDNEGRAAGRGNYGEGDFVWIR